jgi:hypothetical protein
MSRPTALYILKVARESHVDSPILEQVLKAYRRGIVEHAVGPDQADVISEMLSALDDEAFASVIAGLRLTLEAQSEASPEVRDITHEILKNKYGGKQ